MMNDCEWGSEEKKEDGRRGRSRVSTHPFFVHQFGDDTFLGAANYSLHLHTLDAVIKFILAARHHINC